MEELTVSFKLTRAQLVFLRTRYEKNKNTNASTLVRMAMLEIVRMQAEKEVIEAEQKVRAETRRQAMEDAARV